MNNNNNNNHNPNKNKGPENKEEQNRRQQEEQRRGREQYEREQYRQQQQFNQNQNQSQQQQYNQQQQYQQQNMTEEQIKTEKERRAWEQTSRERYYTGAQPASVQQERLEELGATFLDKIVIVITQPLGWVAYSIGLLISGMTTAVLTVGLVSVIESKRIRKETLEDYRRDVRNGGPMGPVGVPGKMPTPPAPKNSTTGIQSSPFPLNKGDRKAA